MTNTMNLEQQIRFLEGTISLIESRTRLTWDHMTEALSREEFLEWEKTQGDKLDACREQLAVLKQNAEAAALRTAINNVHAQRDEEQDNARAQAFAHARSIAALVAAVEVDYDRLEELRELYDGSQDGGWSEAEAEELADLEEAANGCEDQDEAYRAIQEDALCVEVRSGWADVRDFYHAPAEDFRILLCTGGPHVEIRGELTDGEPSRAWIEYKGWGTSGSLEGEVEQETLLTYASQFFAS